ncbi:type II secretion system ATPase GspE [Halopseudomonas salegens]|uniref:Type II secretion system protein E n=1 Tax=Halopseudomonas salegens TaxID=1434072 RepID=A0A1H2HWF7_9GAMM|nr:type II secretion system ATPase GspE [Halopseudomonas salegens]SDU36055.1 general secretion pathway protein E [Halopseudomonas salegens]
MQDLGQWLIDAGKISATDLQRAEQVQKLSGGKLNSILTRLGLLAERDLADILAEQHALPRINADDYPELPPEGLEAISPLFLREQQVLPLRSEDGVLSVAMVDPADDFLRQSLGLASGQSISPQVALGSELDAVWERWYGEGAREAEDDETAVLEAGVADEDDVERLRDLASEAPVIRLVNSTFTRALDSRASDIHVEPFDKQLVIRFRIDGVMQEVERPPSHLAPAVISRLKILAKLNIAERRLPQDGRIQLRLQGRLIDLRVSTVPTMHGESVVMRILDKQSMNLNLDAIGLSDQVLNNLKAVLDRPNGIFLVTGPTGSGKTTTLYAALSRLNTVDRKILTVEDPVEYQIPGVNQIQTASKVGLDFANALRSILRQDPDVVMIGEMRDRETAGIAIQAALTGHIVLSTLHTNDAPSAITRLLDMGLEDYLLTSTVNAIMAQRLVRVLCPECRTPQQLDADEIEHMQVAHLLPAGEPTLWQATGCSACAHTGYRGRMGIHEMLMMDDAVRHLVLRRAGSEEIYQVARAAGMRTMFEDGFTKALAGQTSLAEVLRVAQLAR